jgi:hypothetical protein
MPADVSQFIQMQRLRSLQARQPAIHEKVITHLYQPQVTSSGITEFLPDSKTKFVSGTSENNKKYNYVPGIHTKPKTLPRNAF